MMLKMLNWEYATKRWLFVDTNYGWYIEGAIILLWLSIFIIPALRRNQ